MSNIESVLQESRMFPPSEAMVKQANVSGMAAYRALCDEADRDFEGFWAGYAENGSNDPNEDYPSRQEFRRRYGKPGHGAASAAESNRSPSLHLRSWE